MGVHSTLPQIFGPTHRIDAFLAAGATLVDAHNTDVYHARYDFGVQYNDGTTYYFDGMRTIVQY